MPDDFDLAEALRKNGSRYLVAIGFFIVAYILIQVIFGMFVTYIGPNEFGVKVVRIGFTTGIMPEVYTTGWALKKPFDWEEIYRFPKGLQLLDLTKLEEKKEQSADYSYYSRSSKISLIEKPAKIRTSDGFYVEVDISILYRIVDPVTVMRELGAGNLYIQNGILPRAEPALKSALGALTTEDFYDSNQRTQRVKVARDMLQKEVENMGMQIDQILIRHFRYSPEIQKNIEEKKLKDQLVFKNQSEKRAATEEALLKKVVQEGEANVTIKLEEGNAYVVRKKAEQDLYVRKKRAEADLQVELADAYATKLRNEAFREAGSNRRIGLEMAEVLKGVNMLVLPSDGVGGFNPLDLEKTLKMFDAE